MTTFVVPKNILNALQIPDLVPSPPEYSSNATDTEKEDVTALHLISLQWSLLHYHSTTFISRIHQITFTVLLLIHISYHITQYLAYPQVAHSLSTLLPHTKQHPSFLSLLNLTF